MKFQLLLGASPIGVDCPDAELRAALERYYAPALGGNGQGPSSDISIASDGTVICCVGSRSWTYSGNQPAVQFESALIHLLFELHPGALILHAGCVQWHGLPIVFLAASGGGKSSLTRAALQAGAAYLSDDTVLIQESTMYGFARAVRFKDVPKATQPLPAYLDETTLDGYGLRGSSKFWTPIWWQGSEVLRQLRLETPVAVVRVSRGPDSVRPMTEVERLVALHEAAIVKAGEYDGSLGPGPGFELTWEDPDRAFSLLTEALENIKGS